MLFVLLITLKFSWGLSRWGRNIHQFLKQGLMQFNLLGHQQALVEREYHGDLDVGRVARAFQPCLISFRAAWRGWAMAARKA